MAIKRQPVKPEDHFTIVANAWLRDYRLTLKARGLLALVLSHKVGWDVTIETLARDNPEGRDAIRSAVAELEEHGYLRRRRAHGDDGRFAGYDYELVYDPPSSGFPTTGEPTTGEPTTGNPTQRRPSSKKTSSKEDHLQESAPDGDAAPEWVIAKRAYDATDGALKFMAIKAIAKWALTKKHETPERVERGIADLHHRGKPVTRATLDQWLSGALDRRPSWDQSNEQRMDSGQEMVARARALMERQKGIEQ